MKVAIACDWLVGGGAEKVVLELHRMFPEAPIYTSYATNEWRQKLDGKVVTGYLQHLPRLRKYVPFLRAYWFSHLNLSGYDLVISSSGAEAKGVRVKKPAIHINYCNAPTHYYWDRYDEYLRSPGFPKGFNWLARLGLKVLVGPMRKWDFAAAQRSDHMIANSSYTQSKIKQYYNRDSVVVHPPVDVERFAHFSKTAWHSQAGKAQGANENRKGDVHTGTATAARSLEHSDTPASNGSVPSSAGQQDVALRRSGFVVAGRQTPYKRIDLAVAACTQLGLDLTVIGNGPDHKNLVKMAGPTVTFINDANDEQLGECLGAAEAFILPNADDFGIVAVEALAAGTPLIAYKDGGALDYVTEDETGLFFNEQSVESLVSCLKNFNSSTFNFVEIQTAAQSFSNEAFTASFRKLLQSLQ